MASSRASDDIAATVSKLSLKTDATRKTTKGGEALAAKEAEIVDDWEDEAGSDEGDSTDGSLTSSVPAGKAGTDPPPPTPISPTTRVDPLTPSLPLTMPGQSSSDYGLNHVSGRLASERTAPRPEKTDAVARRMIAASLGMKMPKRTEEQKGYDKAMREKERKRRDEEREAQRRKDEESAKAKQAIWDD